MGRLRQRVKHPVPHSVKENAGINMKQNKSDFREVPGLVWRAK